MNEVKEILNGDGTLGRTLRFLSPFLIVAQLRGLRKSDL
jgi:hypothetical protein